MYFSDAMAYNQQAQQYVLAAQMQHAGQVVQQQAAQQAQQVPKQEPVANTLHAAQQQAQTIAEQQHQAAAALELSNAAAAAPAQNTNAMNIRRPFDPTAHELDANFRLTRFADLKG